MVWRSVRRVAGEKRMSRLVVCLDSLSDGVPRRGGGVTRGESIHSPLALPGSSYRPIAAFGRVTAGGHRWQ